MTNTEWYEALERFEPRGFLTDKGYVGYSPWDKDRGTLYDTEQEYVDWIRELKKAFLGESGE